MLAAGSTAHLAPIDWAIVIVYLLGALTLGAIVGRRARTTEDYLLTSRRTPFWAAGLSLLATSLSVATFVGAPQVAYDGDLTYLSLSIGSVLAAIIVAAIFIPAFYRAGVMTVYELLENRFGSGARVGASVMFLIGRLFASGARLFIAGIPISLILFGDTTAAHLVLAISVIACIAIVYTMMGGIGAIIWTDVAQVVILVGAGVATLALLLRQIDLPVSEIVETLRSSHTSSGGSKLTLIDTSLDLSKPFTLWTALIGITLLNVAAMGTDQDLAQRLLTCRSWKRGAAAALLSNLLGVAVVALFLIIGLLLWLRDGGAASAGMTTGVGKGSEALTQYLLTQMPIGVRGLVVAGIAAAAMSSLDSALGAMSSASVQDVYKRWAPGKSDRHYLRMSRAAAALWGALLAGLAIVFVFTQKRSGEGLIEFALGVMVLAYGGLLGVFLVALLTKQGNNLSAIAALIAGFLTAVLLQYAPMLGVAMDWSLGWRMLAATVISVAVCAAGSASHVPTRTGESA